MAESERLVSNVKDGVLDKWSWEFARDGFRIWDFIHIISEPLEEGLDATGAHPGIVTKLETVQGRQVLKEG